MDPIREYPESCRNIFQNGRDLPSAEAYTWAWIRLINRLEKEKIYHSGSLRAMESDCP